MAAPRSGQYGQFRREVTLGTGPITLDRNLDELTLAPTVRQVVMRVGSLNFMIQRFNDTFLLDPRTDSMAMGRRGLSGVTVAPASSIKGPDGNLWVATGPEIARFGFYHGRRNTITSPLPGISVYRQFISEDGLEAMKQTRGDDFTGWPLKVDAYRNYLGEDGGSIVTTAALEQQLASDKSVAGGTSVSFTYTDTHELLFNNGNDNRGGSPMVVELTAQLSDNAVRGN